MWAGSQPKQIIVTGGLSRFSMLCQRLADLSQVSVHRPPDHEATALGVAYLAAGCPLHWAKPGRGTQFLPAPNDELRRRFNRWKSVMDKAVGETSGAGAAQS
jgi:glycerol kinase